MLREALHARAGTVTVVPVPPRRLVDIAAELTVVCCRKDPIEAPSHDPFAALAGALAQVGAPIHYVGPRPGKDIDPLLAGRVMVIGDDSDLAAVVLRLLRTNRLGTGPQAVTLGYLTPGTTAFTLLHGLPVGTDALAVPATERLHEAVLLRSDVGGVLIGEAEISPVDGTVYVDDRRVLFGSAHRIRVRPDAATGLSVSVEHRRRFGLGVRSQAFTGRATSIGAAGMTVVSDGVPHRRETDRWTFYRHTEPLQLLRP